MAHDPWKLWLLTGGWEGSPGGLAENCATALRAGLNRLGVGPGDYTIEFKYADGDPAAFQGFVAGAAEEGVNVIVALDSRVPRAIGNTREYQGPPVVMAISGDPTMNQRIESIEVPGVPMTGVYSPTAELTWRRLQILQEAFPGLSNVWVLRYAGQSNRRMGVREFNEAERAAVGLGLPQPVDLPIVGTGTLEEQEAEIQQVLEPVRRSSPDERSAFVVLPAGIMTFHQRWILELMSQDDRPPAFYVHKEYVDEGGLMSFGPDRMEMVRQAGAYAGRILRGANPAHLSMERPRRYEFGFNAYTAAQLGVQLPAHLMAEVTHLVG